MSARSLDRSAARRGRSRTTRGRPAHCRRSPRAGSCRRRHRRTAPADRSRAVHRFRSRHSGRFAKPKTRFADLAKSGKAARHRSLAEISSSTTCQHVLSRHSSNPAPVSRAISDSGNRPTSNDAPESQPACVHMRSPPPPQATPSSSKPRIAIRPSNELALVPRWSQHLATSRRPATALARQPVLLRSTGPTRHTSNRALAHRLLLSVARCASQRSRMQC